jgi:hypothetical protein
MSPKLWDDEWGAWPAQRWAVSALTLLIYDPMVAEKGSEEQRFFGERSKRGGEWTKHSEPVRKSAGFDKCRQEPIIASENQSQ